MNNSDIVYLKWKSEFEKLLAEINHRMMYYDRTKKCECVIEDCKHFEKERDRLFGSRINDLFTRSIKNGMKTLTEIDELYHKN